MENTNEMTIIFDSRPANEALARVAVASFCTQLNPTLEEVSDLKTAVSEAVTNCIIHGYEGEVHKIRVDCSLCGQELKWMLQITEPVSRISRKPWNLCLPPDRTKTVRAWDLHLWRHSWMKFLWNRRLAAELPCT